MDTKVYEELISEYIMYHQNEKNIKVPTNTIARIFNKESHENFISDWIAYLIDPEKFGSDEPLCTLLSLAGYENVVGSLSNVEVYREHTFADQRRIDFLIETDECIIGIENKIWSDLGYQQLEDYDKSLKEISNGRTIIKVLLFPANNKGEGVQKTLIESKTGFVPITYEQYANGLRDIRFNFIDNLRSAFMLQDFIVYVEEYLMEDGMKKDIDFDLVKFLYDRKMQLKEIEDSKNSLREQFINYIKTFLDKEYSSKGWIVKVPRTGNYYQIYKPEKGWNSDVHFELLLSDDDFPQKSIQVALHTREVKSLKERVKELYDMEELVKADIIKEYGQDTFDLDYDNGFEGFKKSMEKPFEILEYIIGKYTSIIDKHITR